MKNQVDLAPQFLDSLYPIHCSSIDLCISIVPVHKLYPRCADPHVLTYIATCLTLTAALGTIRMAGYWK